MKILEFIKYLFLSKDNIDFNLQKKLREKVSIEDSFIFNDKKYYYKIDSDEGLVFYDEGINKYHFFGYINNDRGKKIFYQYWLLDPLKPTIFFIHGNAENSSSHPLFLFYFIKRGYNILTFDQEGYGSSDGIRGTIEDLDYYFQNIDLVYKFYYNKLLFLKKGALNLVSTNELKDPEFIFIGFSMGGFEVFYYLFLFLTKTYINNKNNNKKKWDNCEFRYLNSVKKIILLCPWLYTHKRLTNHFILFLISIFYKFFNPYILLSQKTQNEIFKKGEEFYIELYKNLTDNYDYLKRRFKDKRIHRLRSIRWLAYITKYQNDLYKYIKKLSILFNNKKNKSDLLNLRNILEYYCKNIIFYIGENDIIVDQKRIYKISEIIQSISKEKNLYSLPGFCHDFLDYDEKRLNIFLDLLQKHSL
ncbi:MAG: lysophospholipase [Spirochaetes bacterium]|nr:lysophospholipase [Spirochaetota bacterium]